jgi:hypothetical protein
MRYSLERFPSGWIGLSLSLRPEEVDRLISLLQAIKSEGGHFHFAATDWSENDGLADVEIDIQGESETDNMTMSSLPIAPDSPL